VWGCDGKRVRGSLNSKGYVQITVAAGQKILLHRLVAALFLDSPLVDQTQINHIDGNKRNNAVSNLEWCTPSENVRHAVRIGLR
jgi:hypothetical protein